MPEPILEIAALEYGYPGCERSALSAIDLELHAGEFVLLAGRSGSGKSTLLGAAAGLVPHFHGGEFSGRVESCGLDTRDHGPAQLSRYVSTVFQDPERQVVMNGVRAELALPLENRGAPAHVVARSVEEVALMLGIGDLLDRSVHTLSGGELQRVALGAALVTRPSLLLLDEPTSQLDPVSGEELIWQLRRLNEEWGTTVLLAEQRLERCLPAADRVVVMSDGAITFDGAPGGFLDWAERADPVLLPPVARMFSLAGLRPLPSSVKRAAGELRARGVAMASEAARSGPARRVSLRERRRQERDASLAARSLWVEYDDGSSTGVAALRGLELRVRPGEVLGLLGRNGAGKSTLLATAAGLIPASRGSVEIDGEIALVVQNPDDYLLHERVRDELPSEFAEPALAQLGLAHLADRDPRDLSGGERQRLAIAIVLAGRGIGGGRPPAVVGFDEPTRGLDREWKQRLGELVRELSAQGSAVIVATHDIEFAAAVTDRCALLGRGESIAVSRTTELLAGGQYFTTEVARVLGPGAAALLPEQGATWLLATQAGLSPAAGTVAAK